MREDIDISVVIPVYNCREYIEQCVNSLLDQKGVITEIVLINDGSADGTEIVLEGLAEQYSEIRVITQKNSGSAAARNKGIENIRGKYVLFVDADDYVLPGSLEILFQEAEKWKLDVLRMENYYKFSHKKRLYRRRLYPMKMVMNGIDYFELMLKKRCYYTSTFSNMIRTDFLKKLPFRFDEKLWRAQDMEFFTKVILKAGQIKNLNYPYYVYNLATPTGGAVSRYNTQLLFDCYKYILNGFRAFARKENFNRVLAEKLDYLVCSHVYFYNIEILKELPKEELMEWKAFMRKYMFRNKGWLHPYVCLHYLKLFYVK